MAILKRVTTLTISEKMDFNVKLKTGKVEKVVIDTFIANQIYNHFKEIKGIMLVSTSIENLIKSQEGKYYFFNAQYKVSICCNKIEIIKFTSKNGLTSRNGVSAYYEIPSQKKEVIPNIQLATYGYNLDNNIDFFEIGDMKTCIDELVKLVKVGYYDYAGLTVVDEIGNIFDNNVLIEYDRKLKKYVASNDIKYSKHYDTDFMRELIEVAKDIIIELNKLGVK
ncbi:MAG: hypothetical protein RSB54_02780 [Bacilli bacterium]